MTKRLFKLLTIISFFSACMLKSHAQVIYPFGNASYLGFGFGQGTTRTTTQSTSPNGSNGEYYCKSKLLAFRWGFSHLGGGKKSVHFGYYFAGMIGASPSKFYIIPTNSGIKDPTWQTDLNVLAEFKLGLQAAYMHKKSNSIVGLRYFNCYAADALRSAYGNKDDGATLGLFYGGERLGVDMNYTSAKIPGILVDSKAWTYYQIDTRYKVGNWDDGDMTWYVGLRYEYSVLKDPHSFLNLDGTHTAHPTSWMLTLGTTTGKKKK